MYMRATVKAGLVAADYYKQYNDIMKVIGGETNWNNFETLEGTGQAEIVNTTPSGWTLEEQGDDWEAPNDSSVSTGWWQPTYNRGIRRYYYFLLKAPFSDNPSEFKYLLFFYNNPNEGYHKNDKHFYVAMGSEWDSANKMLKVHGDDVIKSDTFINHMNPSSSTYYLDFMVNKAFIGFRPLSTVGWAYNMWFTELARENPAEVAGKKALPFVMFRSYSGHDTVPWTHPYFDPGYKSTTRLHLSVGSEDIYNFCRYVRLGPRKIGGVDKFVGVIPELRYREYTRGSLASNAGYMFIGQNTDTPFRNTGATVVDPDTGKSYVVWCTGSYVTPATGPILLVEKS